MKRFAKPALSSLLVALLLTSFSFAGGKEDAARALLQKSFQQADLWSQGPVKLAVKVRMPAPNGTDITLDYTVSWAAPDKWRAEWSAPGLQQVTVLNNGKLSYFTNQPAPLVRAVEFESAIATVDGGNPAGPYATPPLDYQKAKLDVTKKKINGADATCVAFGTPVETLCVDNVTAHLLTADGQVGTFEYSDYATVGTNAYPQTVKVSYAKTLMEEGKVTVSRGEKFADSLFTPPEKSTSLDVAACADIDKNFTAPHLNKSVPPKMPDAAKKAKKYGVVWVMTTVGKDGSVEKATSIGGDPDLNPSAIEAARQYKYTPYIRCGQAVAFQDVVVVPFAPPSTGKPQEDIVEGGR
ncbi:MAG: energy transducer TonB [Candidatus Korobacteraceae bacterium]